MRVTGFGALLYGLVLLGFGTAFWLGTLAPALVAVLLLAFLEGAKIHVRRATIQVTRQGPLHATLGRPIHVVTTAVGPVPMRVEDTPPPGIRVLHRVDQVGPGRCEERLTVIPESVGTHRWTRVTVHVLDPWGTHEAPLLLAAPTVIRVHPEPEYAARGRRIGRRHTVQSLVRSRYAFESIPEVEGIREYRPGDRLRDVDWARSSRLGELYTKQRVRVAPRPVLILLEATASMRWQRRTAKITTAARFASAMVTAARTSGVLVNLLSVQDDAVVPLGLALRGDAGSRQRLEGLPAPIPVQDLPLEPAIHSTVTAQDRHALQAMALVQGPRAPPMDEAVSRLKRTVTNPVFMVLILDGEWNPHLAEVTVRRLAGQGHRVVVVVPATGAHQYRRHEVTTKILKRLQTWHHHRHYLASRLRSLGVPVVSLRPDNLDAVVEEVAAWAE